MIESKMHTGIPQLDTTLSFIVGGIYGFFKSGVTWKSFTSIKDFPFAELQDVVFWSFVCGFLSTLGSKLLKTIWAYFKPKNNNQDGAS